MREIEVIKTTDGYEVYFDNSRTRSLLFCMTHPTDQSTLDESAQIVREALTQYNLSGR